jgi:hypothetical protein
MFSKSSSDYTDVPLELRNSSPFRLLLTPPAYDCTPAASCCSFRESQSHIATDGLGVESHLGLMIRYLLLFESYGLVFVWRPLWREDGSVFCICCWPSPGSLSRVRVPWDSSPRWGSTPRLTDWLTVSRNVTLTWGYRDREMETQKSDTGRQTK